MKSGLALSLADNRGNSVVPACSGYASDVTIQARAAGGSPLAKIHTLPGSRKRKTFAVCCRIHSMSVTTAIRSQRRRCPIPTRKSSHIVPASMPMNCGVISYQSLTFSCRCNAAVLRTSGMGSAYGFGGIGKIIGPIGLALIVGSSNIVKPRIVVTFDLDFADRPCSSPGSSADASLEGDGFEPSASCPESSVSADLAPSVAAYLHHFFAPFAPLPQPRPPSRKAIGTGVKTKGLQSRRGTPKSPACASRRASRQLPGGIGHADAQMGDVGMRALVLRIIIMMLLSFFVFLLANTAAY